jgi:hypothetical protein
VYNVLSVSDGIADGIAYAPKWVKGSGLWMRSCPG